MSLIIPTKTTITNLVHIGFHKEETPEFDAALKKYISEISSDVDHLINFVNVKNDSQEEAERRQSLIFFEKLAFLMSGYHLMSSSMKHFISFEQILKQQRIPQEIVDFIESKYPTEISKIRGEKIKVFGNVQTGPSKEEVEADNVYTEFIDTRFKESILALMNEFKGVNLFNLPIIGKNGVPEFHQNNPKRYDSLRKFAVEMLGENRVKDTFLNDGQPQDFRTEIQMRREIETTGISEGPSKSYGDAETLYADLRSQDGFANMNSVIDYIERTFGFENFKKALHIIGGEYFGRCVHTQQSFLSVFKIKAKILEKISLTPEGEVAGN